MGTPPKNISRLTWVYVSGAAFILFLVFSIILIAYAPRLSSFGITKSIFYILLIPAGLCSAAFLFGAMRSHAKYSGKISYGQLELSGPVVIFCLVILGGIFLAEPSSTFLLTVRVHKSGDKGEIIRSGKIILDLASQRIERDIGENGEVLFAGVPSEFLGKEINLLPNVPGFSAVTSETYKIPDGKVIFLELTQKKEYTTVRGTVFDTNGNPLKNVTIDFKSGSAIALSNENGNFSTTVEAAPGTIMLVIASLNGKIGYRDYITISQSESITIPYNNTGK